jgi:hypothetical protein
LSSFEESEDDCDKRVKKVDAKYRISFFHEEVLDIAPWYEKERSFLPMKTDRAQTQTIPTHGFLLDKSNETESITFEVTDIQKKSTQTKFSPPKLCAKSNTTTALLNTATRPINESFKLSPSFRTWKT